MAYVASLLLIFEKIKPLEYGEFYKLLFFYSSAKLNVFLEYKGVFNNKLLF